MNGLMYDPSDIERRFAVEDGMAYMESIFEDASEEALERMERVRKLIEDLPPREADFLELYYFRRCTQTDIANIFRVSQPTVCYRLKRAADRIRFLSEIPVITRAELEKDLQGVLSDPIDIDILWGMYSTTCQSAVAQSLNVSQGLIRHRVLKAMRAMAGQGDRLSVYLTVYRMILKNLNIRRQVSRDSSGDEIVRILD